MKEKLIDLLFKYKNAFATEKEPLGAIIGHEVNIILNVEKPYPPLLRRPAYPASPRAREALGVHIKELMDLVVLSKVGHNEQVEVTTPIIITWHNQKSRMVGDFRALNTYTIPNIYPIPRIHETLTQLSQAKLITAMDSPKGFHQNVLTDNFKRQLRIIVHCGIFEYLRVPFGTKNAPVTTTKNDPPPLVFQQFQPGTKLGSIGHTISLWPIWYLLVLCGILAISLFPGLLWPQAISCHPWPPWPILPYPQPPSLYPFFGPGGVLWGPRGFWVF
ncbi:hypothetical protein O181_082056 [Austropuccinia psidii MF-1]|uniref:Reverse transcriptase domain-containing protein n=1 Tax=Austropuccinia psidii MF-1 TaxID=1389203 RepID=A0A9Q3FLE0_9BASI|nr:hypothetical protein [Austropuccinia psidii MF-1]